MPQSWKLIGRRESLQREPYIKGQNRILFVYCCRLVEIWCLDSSVGCLELSFVCLDLSFLSLDCRENAEYTFELFFDIFCSIWSLVRPYLKKIMVLAPLGLVTLVLCNWTYLPELSKPKVVSASAASTVLPSQQSEPSTFCASQSFMKSLKS